MVMAIIGWIIIGIIAGWLAGLVVGGSGFGVLGDMVVGLIGAVIGGWVMSAVLGYGNGANNGGFIWSLAVSFVGAVIPETLREVGTMALVPQIVDAAGGSAYLYGSSSGAVLALFAIVPLVLAAVFGVLLTAALGLALEVGLWRPVRRKRVGELQLLLLALGLAFFMRNAIGFVAGPEDRSTGADVTVGVHFGSLLIGRVALIVTVTGIVAIALTGSALRFTSLGRQARALADNIQLAETTGIDTDRVVLVTWAVSAGLNPGPHQFHSQPDHFRAWARRRGYFFCRLSEVRELMRPVPLPGEEPRFGLCDGNHRESHEFVPA